MVPELRRSTARGRARRNRAATCSLLGSLSDGSNTPHCWFGWAAAGRFSLCDLKARGLGLARPGRRCPIVSQWPRINVDALAAR